MRTRQIALIYFSTLLFAAASPAVAEDVIDLGGFSGIGAVGLVAEHKGYFAAEDLSVRFHRVRSSKEQMRNFIDGTYDIVQTNADNIIAWAEGQGADGTPHDFVIFLGGYRGLARDLFVAPGIESFDDLRGKTLAVDAVDTGYAGVLIYMLRENGLMLNEDYELKSVGNTRLRTESMLRGETVAGFIRWTDEVRNRGFTVLAHSEDYVKDYSRNVAAARTDWAASHRDLLVRYIRAMVGAADWLLDPANRDEAIAVLAAAGDTSVEAATADYEEALDPDVGFIPRLRIERPGLETVIALREVMGVMQPPLPSPEKYIDESYYEEAVQ
ncbi:MAG: ABC transporter substrate-binding protein [Woeseiaceae bacterium]|nr:ABC transporter substrate-binding protein [Woeseiaceae bacterium]